MHPEAKREEPLIREIESARDGIKSVAKDADAVWVPGLEPEHAPLNPQRYHRGGTATSRHTDDIERPGRGRWLQLPFFLGIVALGALVGQLVFSSTLFALAFPAEEHHAWPIIKSIAVADHVLDSLPALVSCVFAVTLCVQLGVASDSFVCFMGVGVSTLTFLATVGDKVLLLRACPDPSPAAECDLPLVLHWLCNLIKTAGPPVAIFMTAGVWDMLLMYKRSGGKEFGNEGFFAFRQWAWILAVPLLFHLHQYWHLYWSRAPSPQIAASALVAQIVVWAFLLLAKVRVQPRFEVRVRDQKKKD